MLLWLIHSSSSSTDNSYCLTNSDIRDIWHWTSLSFVRRELISSLLSILLSMSILYKALLVTGSYFLIRFLVISGSNSQMRLDIISSKRLKTVISFLPLLLSFSKAPRQLIKSARLSPDKSEQASLAASLTSFTQSLSLRRR